MTQEQALDILKMGYSAYLTGEAGTGKTYALNSYIFWLREHGIEPAVTASTGIAATHLSGATIHSWSGIGVRDFLSDFDLDRMEQKKNLWKRFEETSVLIVDEISMLSGEFLEMLDKVCRHMKRIEAPFGGIQVVFCGDFFQLPPISRGDSRAPYAFESQGWQGLNPVTCYLNKQYRQSDEDFSSILSAIRRREDMAKVRDTLANRKTSPTKRQITRLFTHNIDVDALNEKQLSELSAKEYIFEMHARGRKNYVETLTRGCLAPQTLRLKMGAEVMFVKNDQAGKYVNGTQGRVVGFAPDFIKTPIIRTRAGKKIYASPQTWQIEEKDKVVAEILQVPLRLAWAITVHKSQGMTLDEAEMDLSRSFVPGQGYVALSRVRSLEGLYLSGINDMALAVDEYVSRQDQAFVEHSRSASHRLAKLGEEEVQKRHEKFILSCGGSVKAVSQADKEFVRRKERVPTKEQTRQFLEQKLTLRETAEKRGLALSTIIGHAEELVKEGATLDFAYLAPSSKLAKDVQAIVAKSKTGFDFLSPIKSRLEGRGHRVSYDNLRLIRLYINSLEAQGVITRSPSSRAHIGKDG
jgi:ATP-dependent DNA helicase PIF1